MKRKLKIMNHQIDQLKDEISTKESQIAREHSVHEEIEQHKIRLKTEVDRLRNAGLRQIQDLKSAEGEHDKLQRLLGDSEREHARITMQLDTAICDRDVLSSQLLRRNEDLAAVYQKLRLHEVLILS